METKITPKDFFAWAGAMLALYGSITAFISLLFAYINHAYPDPLVTYYVDPYSSSMRFAMASLIVLVPVALVLLRLIRNDIARKSALADIWVRRWALMLTLFLAGAAVVIDLITLVNTFLGGEMTTPFVLKALTILLVAAGVFMHFLADMRGYWIDEPQKARLISWAVGVLVLGTIVSGFFIIGSPSEVRLKRFDDQKVSDLQNIQWQVINYYQTKGKLPKTLEETVDPISGWVMPSDPQGGKYSYEATASLTFELCASFNHTGGESNGYARPAFVSEVSVGDIMNQPWYHEAGEQCFKRTIDPERYPKHKF